MILESHKFGVKSQVMIATVFRSAGVTTMSNRYWSRGMSPAG